MAGVVDGRVGWTVTRDDDGFRNYRVVHRVRTLYADGPQAAMNAVGLPLVGSQWGVGWLDSNDFDPWVFCLPNLTASPDQAKKGEPHRYWAVTQLFSNKPRSERCQDQEIDDPLLEPQGVSGTFTQDTFQAGKGYSSLAAAAAGGARDKLLANSAHEPLRGLNVRDGNPTVRIAQNKAVLGLSSFAETVNTVNDDTLWGLTKRKILLTNVTWERRVQGTCDYYYTRIFDFEVKFDGFDWVEPDYGTMAAKGKWVNKVWIRDLNISDDPLADFARYKDDRGENANTFLDGSGNPAVNEDAAADIDIIYYKESNFLELGIPTIF